MKRERHVVFGAILAICAVIGLITSFTLLHETFEVAKNPSYSPSCNINPLVNCQSAMSSAQAEILGIPNPAFGIAAFAALLTFAVLLFTGVKFNRWVWWAALLAAIGFGFAVYLYLTSVLVLGSICPWCFVTWITSTTVFWAVITYITKEKVLVFPFWLGKVSGFWAKNSGLILAILYAILFLGLAYRFRDALFV